jgi:valyl-tRNA synthetase
MPFITEEIWQKLPHEGASIMSSPWPHTQQQLIDSKLQKQVQDIFNLVTQIRNLRGSIDIKPEQKVVVSLYAHHKSTEPSLQTHTELIMNLARLAELHILKKGSRPAGAISDVARDVDIFLHFTGLLEIDKEKSKIQEKLSQLSKFKSAKEASIKNPAFLKNAPEQIVEKERQGVEELEGSIKRLKKMYSELN